MPSTPPIDDRALGFVSIFLLLVSVGISWVAVDFSHAYPEIYQLPKHETSYLGPVLGIGLISLIVGLPIALTIFRPAKVFLFIVALLFVPLALSSLQSIGNVYFGGNQSITIEGTITGKREGGGWKVHTYLLQVSPRNAKAQSEFAVSYRYYQGANIGDGIVLKVQDGLFGKPWVSSYAKAENGLKGSASN
jgi:hypothetical protein